MIYSDADSDDNNIVDRLVSKILRDPMSEFTALGLARSHYDFDAPAQVTRASFDLSSLSCEVRMKKS